jgi:hypothetical protein
LVDVIVENISGITDDEHPEFNPFSLDAVPYGTEEADLDDLYNPNKPGLEELLGTEDTDKIRTFRMEGAEFTENNSGIRTQNYLASIVDRAIKLRAIAYIKV